MTQKLDELLRKARDFIASGELNNADEILARLKLEHPFSQHVAKLWCSLAMRTDRAVEIPAYAEKFYVHAQSDFHKAHWAHILGTAHFMSLDLATTHRYFINSLDHLLALTKSKRVPPYRGDDVLQQPEQNIFVSGVAEKLLWRTCAELAKSGIQAFPFAGTLLGLVRNGGLLDFDKDLDIGIWMESWEACCAALEQAGWIRPSMHINYANYRDYLHPELGVTLDVCGLKTQGSQIVGGFWLPDHSAEYQRVSIFPSFDLMQRETDYGPVWYPRQPDKILVAFYGDWRTPNPYWDTVVSARNLESFTMLVRCYAYHRLIQYWLLGDLTKTWCYAHQIALRDPDDVLALRSRQWMEWAMTRLKQELPVWPRNQRPRRVYTRMVADLFHEGHVNFLRAAKALGTHLTVCVVSDERVAENKGKLPVMKQAERAVVVAACEYVDAVMTETPARVTLEFMQQHGFDVYTFACASEQECKDKYALCAGLPAAMIHELAYTPGISTSDLVNRILDGAGVKEGTVQKG